MSYPKFTPTPRVEKTPAEEREISMFGVTKVEMDRMIAGVIGPKMLYAMGILSDVQEMIGNRNEDVRKALNVAKYVMSNELERSMVKPDPPVIAAARALMNEPADNPDDLKLKHLARSMVMDWEEANR